MEKMRFRCHFSIIFESLWQFWIVIFFILLNEIEVIIEAIETIGTEGLYSMLESGGIWGVLAILAITLIVLFIQFLIWRKTWITIDDNLVIVERNTLKKVKDPSKLLQNKKQPINKDRKNNKKNFKRK